MFISGISPPQLFHPMEAMAHFWMINMRILPYRPYGLFQKNGDVSVRYVTGGSSPLKIP